MTHTNCRHPDIQVFDEIQCCLSCGETVFDSSYHYRRLNHHVGQEIRLLILFPGEEHDRLTCDIIHVDLAEMPAYEALSYTWATMSGDTTFTQAIHCQGKTIALTKNCEAALRFLRRRGRSRTLWVDAICINQSHTAERNHQVKMMARIYSYASQVLAYLGPGSPHTRVATNRVMEHLNGTSDALIQSSSDRMWDDVNTFLTLPYFDRVWILQEIGLGKLVTLIAGDKTVRWSASTVSTMLWLCSSLNIEPPSVLRWLPASQPEKEDFLDVLHKSRNCSATDPRDKVYALLGLVEGHVSNAISVDYSLTPVEVFTRVATYFLMDRQSLAILRHTSSKHANTSLGPSWVPQWNVKELYEPTPPQFMPSDVEDLASSWYQPMKTTDPRLPDTTECRKIRQTLLHLEVCERDVPSHSPTGQDLENLQRNAALHPCLRIRAHHLDTVVTLLTPIPKSGHVTLPTGYTEPPALNYPGLCSSCFPPGGPPPDCSKGPKRRKKQREAFRKLTQRLQEGSTTFLTDQSIGFTRERPFLLSVRPDDTIWALVGADVPLILRKVDNHYVLLGECYLYRATQGHPCVCCGDTAKPWPMVTEVIDIW